MSNLRWTHDEINTVAKGAVYLLQKGGGYNKKSAVLAAQDRWLGEARRKSNFTQNLMKTLDRKIDEFGSVPFDQLSLREPVAAEAKKELQQDAEQRERDAAEDAQRSIEDRVKEHLRSIQPELTLAAAVATLLRELAKPVSDLIEAKMERVVETAVAKHTKIQIASLPMRINGGSQPRVEEGAPAPEEEKKSKGDLAEKFYEPKIMFLGLMGKQPSSLKNQFRHIDIRVFEPHTNKSRIEEMSKKADYCYIMARTAPPKLKLHCQHSVVNGGISNLCHLIIDRFGTCGEEAAQKRAARQAKH